MSVKQREKYGDREEGGRQPGVNACTLLFMYNQLVRNVSSLAVRIW